MRLTHLSLQDFRNYAGLDLDLPAGPVLFAGENAQGKTNLLEAVYLLATTRAIRATTDAEVIRRAVRTEPLAAARVVGAATGRGGPVQVEVTVGRRGAEGPAGGTAHVSKRLRVDGIPQRAADVVGRIPAVLFTTLDIDLITGPPAGRRRYLDISLSQQDHGYLRALQRYTRVVQQRNSLLRHISEGHAAPDQLATWDDELVTQGARITATRARAVAALHESAIRIHSGLSDERERLDLRYTAQVRNGSTERIDLTDPAAVVACYHDALRRQRPREIAAGQSLVGPHRDDLQVTLDGESAAAYGSRAQQRTVALAMRLAEADYLREGAGEPPVLLLDDILSELDERRRLALLRQVAGVEQALITTADPERFGTDFLRAAAVYRVHAGLVTPDDGATPGTPPAAE